MRLQESFDAWVCRPLARPVARALSKTSATPNAVTGLSALSSVGAGVSLAIGAPIVGADLLFLAMVLDCADGELARLRGGGTWRGRILDGLADYVCAFSVHVGMLVALTRAGVEIAGRPVHTFEWFLVALFAGVSMSWNSAVLDGLKQRLAPSSIDPELHRYASEVRGPIDRFLYWLLERYATRAARATGLDHPESYPLFRRVQRVGPTHHLLWMLIAALATPAWPLASAGYFLFALIPANLYLGAVLLLARRDQRRERECSEIVRKRMAAEIEALYPVRRRQTSVWAPTIKTGSSARPETSR